MPHIGIEVKERRIKNYWTIEDLAKESKVSKGTIIRIESCRENYSINSVIDIFAALGRVVVVSTKRFKK
jgi:transcriptional regulator with XRE-family HTH domain